MQKYKVAVVLKSEKVLYFTQKALNKQSATWIIRQVADVTWGHEVVSVATVSKLTKKVA